MGRLMHHGMPKGESKMSNPVRNISAIAKREILSFFVSPVAYFVIAGFAVLSGYFFFSLLGAFNLVVRQYNMMPYHPPGSTVPNLNQWVVEGYYHTLIVVLVFLIPLLTMRLIADERKNGTFELLITSPLSVGEIIMGKYLGVASVILIMASLSFIFPVLLTFYADQGLGGPEFLPILSGIGGLVLCALAFASIGMAVSAFTENQVVAAICSMVTLLLLYVLGSAAEAMSGGLWPEVFRYLSPVLQVQDLIKGVVTLQSLVYFGTLITLGVFLSKRALEAYRWR